MHYLLATRQQRLVEGTAPCSFALRVISFTTVVVERAPFSAMPTLGGISGSVETHREKARVARARKNRVPQERE